METIYPKEEDKNPTNDIPIIIDKINLYNSKNGEYNNYNYNLFYCKYSKAFIQTFLQRIVIWDKSGKEMKKEFNTTLKNEKVLLATVNKELTYILIASELFTQNHMIIAFNLIDESAILNLKGSYYFPIDIFFIDSNHFCVIYPHEIRFYLIERVTDEVIEIYNVKLLSSNLLIQNFTFSYDFKLLLILRTDVQFDLYDLSKEEFYSKPYKNLVIPFIPNKVDLALCSFKKGFFRSFTITKEKIYNASNIIRTHLKDPEYLYSKNQFSIEKIYNKPYLVCLVYEVSTIHILNISDLSNFPSTIGTEYFKVKYTTHSNNSILICINNLILAFNIKKKEMVVIDIGVQSNQKILYSYKINIDIPREIPLFKGNIMQYNYNIFYRILFDNEKFYKTREQKEKYNGIILLTRRKKTKELILTAIKEIIMDTDYSKKPHKLYFVLEELVSQMKRREQIAGQTTNNYIKPLPSPAVEFVNIISQEDIYYNVFKRINEEEYTNKQNEMILLFMIELFYILRSANIAISSSFYSIFLSFMQKINEVRVINKYFLFSNCYPISKDICNYFINCKLPVSFIIQKGYDYLLQLKEFPILFEYWVKTKGLKNALLYIKTYIHDIDKKMIIPIIKNHLRTNKKAKRDIFKYVYN